MKQKLLTVISGIMLGVLMMTPFEASAETKAFSKDFTSKEFGFNSIEETLVSSSKLFVYDSGLTFNYPDAVRGVYVTGHSAGGSRFNQLVELMDNTELNAMVIDIKDDFGNLTYKPKEDSPLFKYEIGKPYIKDLRGILEVMEKKRFIRLPALLFLKTQN